MHHAFIHRATYLAGELLCSVKDMIQFTAVLCQICKGDMDDKCVYDDMCICILYNGKSFEEEKLKIVVFLMIYKVLTML